MLEPLTIAMWNSSHRRRITDVSQLGSTSLVRLGFGLNSISLMWEYVPYADGYELQRATDNTFTTNLVTRYDGNTAGVTEQFQSAWYLKFHDTGLSSNTTYYYRVRAKNSTTQGAWSGTKTVTTGSSNKTVYAAGPTLGVTAGDNNVTIGGQPFHGGDTLAISNVESGFWQYAYFINLNGTPTEPITFRNDGQVTGPAMSFLDCSYLNIAFNHESKTEDYGMYIEGYGVGECINIYGLSHHINLGYIKIRGGGYALRLKNEANTFVNTNPSCGIRYMWPSRLHNIEIHHLDCAEHSQDGFYIGSSAPWGGRPFNCGPDPVDYRPSGLANIHIHNCSMVSCGRTGFQLGGMDTGINKFHDNTISECGWEYAADQGAGIAIGGACNSLEIYNNNITRTYREATYSYHFGQLYYHDNITDEIGTISVTPYRGRFWLTITKNGGQTFNAAWDQAGKKAIEPNGEFVYEWFNLVSNVLTLVVTRLGFDYSNTEITMPTASGQTKTFLVKGEGGNEFSIGQKLIAVYNLDKTKTFECEVTSITPQSGTTYDMTVEATSEINGSGTFRNWIFFRNTQDPITALAGIGQTAPGSHAGTTADPYEGLGSNQVLNTNQIDYLTEIAIPGGNAVGSLMLNPFNTKPVDNYGSPAGLMRFRIENNDFGSQQAASTKVIHFLNSTNNYGTNNVICNNTYLSDPIEESNITKPGGGVVTYTLSEDCIPTGNLVEQNETFVLNSGNRPGLVWLPDDYDEPANSSRTHPLIIFLHGAGEASSSRNNSLLKSTSLPEIIATSQWNGISQDPDSGLYYKFIVAAPQAPEWSYSGVDLGAAIAHMRTNYRIDDDRIYVTGISAGGSGSISVGSSSAGQNYTAAIVPVAAAGYNNGTQNTEFDNVMIEDIKMITIAGNDDSWKTFCQEIVDRYNGYSPAPSTTSRRILMSSPAGHNENTWNECFKTTFDASGPSDGPYNVYQWMLLNAK